MLRNQNWRRKLCCKLVRVRMGEMKKYILRRKSPVNAIWNAIWKSEAMQNVNDIQSLGKCKLYRKPLNINPSQTFTGIELRSFSFVKRLLSSKSGEKFRVDVNKPEPANGVTPLMTAVMTNQEEMVNLILDPQYVKGNKDAVPAERPEDSEEEDEEEEKEGSDDEKGSNEDEKDEEMEEEEEEEKEEKEDEDMEQDSQSKDDGDNEEDEEKDIDDGSDARSVDDDRSEGLTSKSLFARQPAQKEEAKKAAAKPKGPAAVTLKSAADVNAVDNEARTAAHYCVAPIQGMLIVESTFH